MTLDEADMIIAELNVCFPNKKLLVEEVHRWEQNLSQFNFDDAKRAVITVENSCKFWPSWAEFREALNNAIRSRAELESREKAIAALPAYSPTNDDIERIHRIISDLKQTFTRKV